MRFPDVQKHTLEVPHGSKIKIRKIILGIEQKFSFNLNNEIEKVSQICWKGEIQPKYSLEYMDSWYHHHYHHVQLLADEWKFSHHLDKTKIFSRELIGSGMNLWDVEKYFYGSSYSWLLKASDKCHEQLRVLVNFQDYFLVKFTRFFITSHINKN